MTVELLYFEGCPSYQALLPRLEELIARSGLDTRLELRRVETPEQAEEERFLGSPTVRIDGRDVDPSAAERTDFGLQCRLYRTPDGASGIPPEAWILAALAGATEVSRAAQANRD